MNPVYQILSSSAEIIIAVAFVIVASRLRINHQNIILMSVPVTGEERISIPETPKNWQSISELLAIQGIVPGNKAQIPEQASSSGLLYYENMMKLSEIGSKTSKISIMPDCVEPTYRKMYLTNPISGILLAKLMDKNIEMV